MSSRATRETGSPGFNSLTVSHREHLPCHKELVSPSLSMTSLLNRGKKIAFQILTFSVTAKASQSAGKHVCCSHLVQISSSAACQEASPGREQSHSKHPELRHLARSAGVIAFLQVRGRHSAFWRRLNDTSGRCLLSPHPLLQGSQANYALWSQSPCPPPSSSSSLAII